MENKRGHIVDDRHDEALQRVMRLFHAMMDQSTSPEQKRRLRDWFASEVSDALKQEAFDNYLQYIEPNIGKPSEQARRRYQKLALALGISGNDSLMLGKSYLRRRILRVAAVLVPIMLITGISLFLLPVNEDKPASEIIAVVSTIAVTDSVSRHVELPDGSQVWLGEESRVEYNEDFKSGRRVNLYGEGYFSVVKQEGKPFEVEANGLTVRVLGTEFFVSSPENGGQTDVTLASGKVEVITHGGDIIHTLAPRERLQFDCLMQSVITQTLNEEEISEVVQRRNPTALMTIREILARISTVYGVSVAIDDSFPVGSRLKIEINGEVPLEDILFAIQTTSDPPFDYHISDEVLHIRKR